MCISHAVKKQDMFPHTYEKSCKTKFQGVESVKVNNQEQSKSTREMSEGFEGAERRTHKWTRRSWILYSKDISRFLYIVATSFRHIQAKKSKDTNTKTQPKSMG